MANMRAGLAALAFLGWCGFAHALGLGEIDVHSRLNQQILADIPISSAAPEELDELTVELASNTEFERAGMERPEFLSSLRFAVDGQTIKVTSKQIAREPFISFLVNVRWHGGRLLREYTILLDPPAGAAAAGVSKPKPASELAAPSAPPAGESVAAAPSAPAALQPSEVPAASAAPAPSAEANPAGGTYGPISPKETLWSIAYKLRPDPATITMDQMQVAIFNANPKAFDDGKLTGLMKGVTLRIPSADEIRAVDPAGAKAQVAAARNAQPMPPMASAEPMPAPTPAPEPKKEPKAEPAPAPAPAPAEPPPPAEPTPAPQTAQAEPTPAPPPPPAEAPKTESQAAAPAEPPAEQPAPATQPTPSPTAAPPIPEEPGMVAGLLEQARSLVDHPLFIPAAAGFVVLLLLVFGGRKIADKIAKMRYEAAARKAAAPAPAAPSVGGDQEVTQIAEAPSMEAALQEASDAPTVVAATQTMSPGVAATQAMGGVAATQAMGSDTMQQTMQQTQVQEPAQAASGKVDFDVTGSFASETVQINLDAGDPVSEAEFHRAYGLYDEAALLLKQALQKDPKRTDARVKLAEIYFEASKANEFVEVAKELKGQLSPDEWQKIALLGSQIAPTHELFSGGGGGAGPASVDLTFDEPAPAAAAPAAAPAPPPAPAADAGLEFKLEDVQLPETPAAAPAAAAPAASADTGLEFDLGSLTIDTPAESAPAAAPAAEAPAAPAGDAALDLGSFDLSAPADTSAPAGGGGEVVELSADLGGAGGGDESSTKLDLARAYIDMGDNDMAKSLLNEVSQQGSDEQKKEAAELLKRVPA